MALDRSGADGAMPDSRYMAPARHAAWDAIVLEGTLATRGMPAFNAPPFGMTAEDSHAIQFSKVRDEFLSKPSAAWTAIGISALALPTAHMEMRVIAQLG